MKMYIIKKHLKTLLSWLMSLRKWYDNLDNSNKNILITFFNYSLNAVPVSVLFYFVFSLWYDLNWFVVYICTIIFLFYGEYYYKWLRVGYNM